MDLGINGKVALVLGAGGGLGGAIARELAGEGAGVVVADIDGDAAGATVAAIEATGGSARAVEAWDLGDLSLVESRISDIEQREGDDSPEGDD